MYPSHINSPTFFGTQHVPSSGILSSYHNTLERSVVHFIERLPDVGTCGVPKHVGELTVCEEYIYCM